MLPYVRFDKRIGLAGTVIVLVVLLRILQSLPLDGSIPGGTDTYSHLFRAWYATDYGSPGWNFMWWGGTTFLRYYSPLTYNMSAILGSVIGWLLAYKLLVDLFFVLTPLAFYFLSRDYLTGERQKSVAVLIFSLSPIYLYALFDGRYPTLMSLLFCIVYWVFLKKFLDEGKPYQLLLASFALGLAIPSHLLISGYSVIVTSFWALLHSKKLRTIRALALIFIFAFLFAAWFLMPLFLETGGFSAEGTSPSNLFDTENVIGTAMFALNMPFFWITQFSLSEFSPWIIFIGMMLLLAVSASTALKPNRTVKEFLPVLVLILIIAITSWRRVLFLAPIPLAILSTYAIDLIKNRKARIFLLIVTVLFVLGAFVSLGRTTEEAIAPELPHDGRVLFVPNYPCQSLFLSPMNGNENIEGWWTIGEVGTKRYTYFSPSNSTYHDLLFNFSMPPEEYRDVLDMGWVNYIAVNESYTDVTNYFEDSDRFRAMGKNEGFMIFELYPKSTYLELDGKPVTCERTTGRDAISVNFKCSPGTLTIKESWHQLWNVSINGRAVAYRPNEYDFMEADVNESGDCTLEMKFSEPFYYGAFKFLCIIPLLWLVSMIYMGKKFI